MVADAREGEAEQSLSSRARDLLQGFSIGFSSGTMAEAGGGDSEDIELGLTLGGCFGSHRRENNGLLRFASIPAVLPRDLVTMEPVARTCSLPSETEEELMRRKELQILKRMEAKRKREERRSSKRTGERFEGNLESWPVEKKRRTELENATSWMSANGSAKEVLYNSGMPNWITADSRPATPLKNFAPASQGSALSQGSSFSGGSESESRPRQGFETAGISGGPEIRSPSRVLSITEQNHQKTSVPPSSATTSEKPISITAFNDDAVGNANTQRKNDGGRVGHGTFELGKNMMEEMPSVFTRGDGPNGRKIEGFLYKYRRGEEVRIVCVCHGSFLTPAEFVKHAGGGDVAHPLRHIVVNPSPATFL